MCNFISVSSQNLEEYFSNIALLFLRYKEYLVDDFQDTKNIYSFLYNFIKSRTPLFWVIVDSKTENFAGFVFLDNLIGSPQKIYGAEITGCIERKYWGKFSAKCAFDFFQYCFNVLELNKIKAQIYPQNLYVRGILVNSGFEKEGLLKSETLRKGKTQDIEVYGLTKNNWNNKQNQKGKYYENRKGRFYN